MKKINAVLLNDTSSKNHLGCQIVIEQIFKYANKHNINIFHSVKNEEDWHEKYHLEYIKKADLIIVNGEGTIHSSKPKAKEILSISKFCKSNNIFATLINTVYENNNEYLNLLTSYFNCVFVRESMSKEALEKASINSEVVPDMVFGAFEFNDKKQDDKELLLFSDNVLHESTLNLWNLYYDLDRPKKEFITLQINNLKSLIRLKRLIKMAINLLKTRRVKNVIKEIKYNIKLGKGLNMEIILSKINDAQLIVTGRFHLAVLALIHNTPLIAVESNTHKIQGLFYDVGIVERVKTIDVINDIDLTKYAFNCKEKKKVKEYVKSAPQKINQMFFTIREGYENFKLANDR